MKTDFPAAHSMDTNWFAVDRDGHVACFDSGESGAVPTQIIDETGGESVLVESMLASLGIETTKLGQLLAGTASFQSPNDGTMFDLRGRLMPGAENQLGEHGGLFPVPSSTLMFLKSAHFVEKAVAEGTAVLVPTTEGVGVLIRGLSEELAKRIHDADECHGCFWYTDSKRKPYPGFFYYGHMTENSISGPYGREMCPVKPTHFNELPADIRERLKWMRFDGLCFRDTPHIQPIEHAPCESWENAFMDVTGTRVSPIPGKEAEYAETYEELKDLLEEEGVVVDPPPGGTL
jgi:hypothetical protein